MTRAPDVGHRRTRWLVFAGLVVAAALVLLAATAERALRERHSLALEGRVITLAHQTEADLRSAGPEKATAALARALERWGDEGVAGLALVGDSGVSVAVGQDLPPDLAGPAGRAIAVYLGRTWKEEGVEEGVAGHAGQRILRVTLDRRALTPPPVERFLLPATTFAGLGLVALALFSGRQLVRYEVAQRGAAERHRLEGLARAGAGLAHQLRTPLATIKGSAQLLLERSDGNCDERRLNSILQQIARVEDLLTHLLDYARPPVPQPSRVALRSLVLDSLSPGSDVDVRIAAGATARADPSHVAAILGNLIDNARRASPPGRPIEIWTFERNDRITLLVGDRGPGPGDEPEAHFEPYSTSRADGTGLGLPIARALAEANGGSLRLMPRDGGGTNAALELPRDEAPA